jgi:hypothetical protein
MNHPERFHPLRLLSSLQLTIEMKIEAKSDGSYRDDFVVQCYFSVSFFAIEIILVIKQNTKQNSSFVEEEKMVLNKRINGREETIEESSRIRRIEREDYICITR